MFDALEFTANYTKTDYNTVAALKGTENDYAVWFGGTVSGSTVTLLARTASSEFKASSTCLYPVAA